MCFRPLCLPTPVLALVLMDEIITVSPTVVTAAVAAVTTVIAVWYWQRRQSLPSSVQSQYGTLILTPNPSSLAEYKRDFERFKQFGGIDGWTDKMDHKLNHIVNAYCMSTSFGMDVLVALKILPPVVHQPLFVVSDVDEFSVSFFGYIGPPKGSRPDRKYSNQILKVKREETLKDGEQIRVSYEIQTYRDESLVPQNIRECA